MLGAIDNMIVQAVYVDVMGRYRSVGQEENQSDFIEPLPGFGLLSP